MTTVTGEVRDKSGYLLADATVRLYRRDTGALLGSAVSGDGSEAVEGDADYASVSLLLHCDGANGSTTFTDNSPTPKTVTAVNNAQIKTDQSKFGGSSAYFDGTLDRLTVPNHTDFSLSSGDFTIEAWVRPTMLDTNDRNYLSQMADIADNANRQFACSIKSTSASFYWTVNGLTDTRFSVTYSFSINTWYHIAWVKSSGTLSCYINGQQTGGTVIPGTLFNSTADLCVGTFGKYGEDGYTHLDYHGYLDDIRITKGVARYTAGFTPPAAAFLDYSDMQARPLGQYSIDTTYSGEVQRIVCAPDAWDPIANDLIDRIILP